MSYLDTLYRAFTEFRKNTADDRDCLTQRSAIAKADADKDSVEVSRVVCKIESDWIDAIEDGLTYVEKALKQERQFIRANGEIVPIEKVKRVSRDSVEHLSRHSNLITKESKGEDLIPEQLYTVERLNDYAVYENRFLYMLLTCLDEFIGMRYTRILELTNTYHGTAVLDKTVSTRQKNIRFKLDLDETRRDDPIMRELNPNKAVIERIGMLLKTVEHYLSTPLMEEVSKAAKLKPPITKTNVLKMDKDFKGAVALYEFIASYDKDGYSVETVKKKMKFSDAVSDEFAEAYALASFLTYQYGMGIKDMLKANYDEEEARRKAVLEQQHLEQLRKLRRRIAENGESPEEYMLLLEKQLRVFEGIHQKLDDALDALDKVKEENDRLLGEIQALNDKADELSAEIVRLEQKYREDMAALRDEHEKHVAELNAEHARRIEEINAAHDEEISALNADHEKEVAELNEDYRAQIAYIEEQHRGVVDEVKAQYEREITDIQTAHRDEIAELETAHREEMAHLTQAVERLTAENASVKLEREKETARLNAEHAAAIEGLNAEVQKKERALIDVKEENRLLGDLKTLSDGRLNAMRHKYGLMTDADDFTSENAFNELEREYEVFRRFFKGEWKKTKKRIRDELLRPRQTDIAEDGKDDGQDESNTNDASGVKPVGADGADKEDNA